MVHHFLRWHHCFQPDIWRVLYQNQYCVWQLRQLHQNWNHLYVNYLGKKLLPLPLGSSKGVSTDPKKIQAVVESPMLATVTKVRWFLALCVIEGEKFPTFWKQLNHWINFLNIWRGLQIRKKGICNQSGKRMTGSL